MKKSYIIAIDGPSGAGKSTVSQMLADKLGYLYLDTGAMYRALGLKGLRQNLDLDDPNAVKSLLSDLRIELKKNQGKLQVFLDGEDVSEEIRKPEMGMAASKVSRHLVVREKMWELQRELGKKGGIVAEGRDIGTMVFPGADFKFFITASPEERARRRFQELKAKGFAVDYQKVLEEVKKRDEQDSKREIAPLKSAEDAIIVDTSDLTIEQVIDKLMEIILQKDFPK